MEGYSEARFDPRELMDQRGPLVEEVVGFPIKPRDIDAKKPFADAFGNTETEVSAGYIVRMCQEKNSWAPFSEEEIEAFYQRYGHKDGFTFNWLVEQGSSYSIMTGNNPVGGGWIVKKDGKYHLTTTFVEAAFRSSPANRPA